MRSRDGQSNVPPSLVKWSMEAENGSALSRSPSLRSSSKRHLASASTETKAPQGAGRMLQSNTPHLTSLSRFISSTDHPMSCKSPCNNFAPNVFFGW